MTFARSGSIGLLLLLSICFAHASFGQIPKPASPYVPVVKDTSQFLIFDYATAGPIFTAGVSRMNENIQPGWHSDPKFAYTFGLDGELLVTPWLGFNLGLLYDTRDMYLATPGDTTSIDMNIEYISVQPSIRIFWLLLGLSFDFPTSASATETIASFDHLGKPTHFYQANRNVDLSDLSSLTELRASLSIPLLHAESGTVHFVASASYPLSKGITGTTSFDSTDGHYAHIGEGPLPSVQAGLSYQFDLLH